MRKRSPGGLTSPATRAIIDPINQDEVIRAAILGRRLVQFDYKGVTKVAEPHDYGVLGGRVRLLVYQTRGQSHSAVPGWRMIDVDAIRNLVMLDETFAGSRARPGEAHKHWDALFLRVA
jgi:hypothetical protein